MAQKRRSSSGRLRRASELDFRSPSDEAWYSVRLHKERDGVLRVMYREFPESSDERCLAGRIAAPAELAEIAGRFRRPALQLQDSECRKVEKGGTVLVCCRFGEDELRFYDAVVDSISIAQHKKSEETKQEICTCKFTVTWQQGPHKGEKVTVGAGDICIIQTLPVKDPILTGFLEKVKSLLQEKGNDKRDSSRRSNGVVQDPSRSSDDESKSKRAVTPQNNSGGELSRGIPSEETQNSSTESYFFWVDNIEKGTTAFSIMMFLKREISVSSQVLLYPFLYNSSCSAAIFVNNGTDANKLFSLLFDQKNIIISSKGSPWVVNERCCGRNKYQMPRLEMNRSEEKLEEGLELKVVQPGSEGYELAEKLLDLHKKYHEHMKGLQATLESEEKKLRASFLNKSSCNGSSHTMIIDLD